MSDEAIPYKWAVAVCYALVHSSPFELRRDRIDLGSPDQNISPTFGVKWVIVIQIEKDDGRRSREVAEELRNVRLSLLGREAFRELFRHFITILFAPEHTIISPRAHGERLDIFVNRTNRIARRTKEWLRSVLEGQGHGTTERLNCLKARGAIAISAQRGTRLTPACFLLSVLFALTDAVRFKSVLASAENVRCGTIAHVTVPASVVPGQTHGQVFGHPSPLFLAACGQLFT
jgi:hypothetical protein